VQGVCGQMSDVGSIQFVHLSAEINERSSLTETLAKHALLYRQSCECEYAITSVIYFIIIIIIYLIQATKPLKHRTLEKVRIAI